VRGKSQREEQWKDQWKETMSSLHLWLKTWLNGEEGQDLIEYALLMGLIALICVVAITAGGQSVSQIWTAIQAALATAAGAV
jgi:pilus assembly protein Flp/PilA